MKLLNQESESFKSFELNLLIETEEEARLLWHVFNRIDLKNAIFSERYDNHTYISKMSYHFAEEKHDYIRDFIGENVKIEK